MQRDLIPSHIKNVVHKQKEITTMAKKNFRKSITDKHYIKLATYFYALRLKQHLSQAELAAKVGVGNSLISQFECGTKKLGYENLVKLAHALGTDTSMIKLMYDRIEEDVLKEWNKISGEV